MPCHESEKQPQFVSFVLPFNVLIRQKYLMAVNWQDNPTDQGKNTARKLIKQETNTLI
jgi:hypothetical protein